MTRYKLVIEYDGSPFVGWQRQSNGMSVQGEVERALKELVGMPVRVFGAGRTDSGVHALGQVAHCDIYNDIGCETVRDALNHFLRKVPISIISTESVEDNYHARFTALRRYYLYRILNRRPPPAFDRNKVWWIPNILDVESMHEAAQNLTGYHDFTSFRAKACQANSPLRTLDKLDVGRYGNEIHIKASAQSFLHHQVRNLVGTLVMVGSSKMSVAEIKAVLNARDRSAAGPTAPPDGLYLVKVDYP
jgi:tRNA pseudouridine38-40 synthase|tara:strand:- start:1262 stop:2002 length:741 start_codon:yes stop_codon:yes gene_type:complete